MSEILGVDNLLDLIDNPPRREAVRHIHPDRFARLMAAGLVQTEIHDCAWLRDLMAEPPSLVVGDWIDEPVDPSVWSTP